ncbi:EEF1A lysine methyltransferase 1 [Gadus morhua]|uniref:EEF1A lysine methyltransferase 1 n=2 Tax=Gadus TaxID=8048 RepID=A0A8C4ZMR2_GADMO|nr:EEF1A lysine methyltransferase 1 [Gadus morhua]XP_030199653.1 EEF1A lysine methyltransferase 1 [Gadus morhua]XP_030199654.1 EEF1A lysine methyltransferase 1 [Gadus morhua]XP_030199655.1 EEF1A lysine methyltransferase 1 [Gadus morhua]XP_030199656.1 EEF1A lysine methyltransferase 1 [Gadus morhua]XP_030199657.1 EEF1A lysine methyltransferase 1 [Gadus morhua]XP_030199658.1 EEF1A lysine methyltransferase 1 [Gadus morhua]XP_030199659.1 EEF1A lysine methyltransferase 1 [Gadus morhua]XP_03019966
MSDSDDDVPRLSADTLAALQEFYNETSHPDAPTAASADKFSVGAVGEDWGMSQFWYDDVTATRLAEEVIQEAGDGGRIACVSAPSVYQKLKQGVVEGSDRISAVLLEYDRRFAAYGDDFLFYDYNHPLALPAALQGAFDIVLVDPPYLALECLSKITQTVKYLSKGKVLLCTGAIMEEHAEELLGLRRCGFLPKHNKNLANEFRCFTSYDSRLLSC